MIRPIIGLDFDDVVAPFNSLACQMANEKYGIEPPLTIHDITSWENNGRAGAIKEFYFNEELYRRQSKSVPAETIAAIRKLMTFADVYFITGVYPEFMTVRVQQIMELFPEISQSRIILGTAKDLVHFDFFLDDNINNVLSSPADYPVLFRKPWNADMTGLLSVNSMDEFLCLVQNIVYPMLYKSEEIEIPSIIALVGPSGSGKNEVADALVSKDARFVRPNGYTTKPNDENRTVISEEEFAKRTFLEKTRYAGHGYGIEKEDVEELLKNGQFPVIPIDICGAIGMRMHFPTIIVYLKKGKFELVQSIITDETLSEKEKTLRILSLEAEKKNEKICDFAFNAKETAENILNLIK